jgi:hypothetical protein
MVTVGIPHDALDLVLQVVECALVIDRAVYQVVW